MSNDYPFPHYIPKTPNELADQLMHMVGAAPTFKTDHPMFFRQSIDTEYSTVQQGLDNVRKKIGEERYLKLIELAALTRMLFEADPDDNNGKTVQGCHVLHEMMDILLKKKAK